jgi:hypothetical protein
MSGLVRSLFQDDSPGRPLSAPELLAFLREFRWNGTPTASASFECGHTGLSVPVFTNEFWTSRQRAASSLHEVSYRACFKPQLPAFFIDRLTRPGHRVYDPFAGRGTTLVESGLRGRVPLGCDVNPLSRAFVWPRLHPPGAHDVRRRLEALDLTVSTTQPEELLVFYHEDTLREICSLREYLLDRRASGQADPVDEWIQMVALNRLTGHSPGFFSVYTLPPNQALSPDSQWKINQERGQRPPRRLVKDLIVRKTRALLSDVDQGTRQILAAGAGTALWTTASAAETFWESASVDLVVTSPPFLDVVDYAGDNWLRCWFCGIDPGSVGIAVHRKLEDWQAFIARVFRQLARLLRPGGYVAFEVGEVRRGAVRLEEAVVPCGVSAGLAPACILINRQTFTKTANIWGVDNNRRGTNTNRIVVFQKPAG